MSNEFLILMKFELLVAVIIFILLFIKVGQREWKNETALGLVNFLLLINFAGGLFYNHDGALFGDMFRTNKLIELEKNILNFGALVISSQAYAWLKDHKH